MTKGNWWLLSSLPCIHKDLPERQHPLPQTILQMLVCSKIRAGSKTSGSYCRPNAYKMQTISRLFPMCSCWGCWAGRVGNICVVYLQSRYSMSISFVVLPLPMYCTSSTPGLNSSQWWENEWGCILLSVLGAIQSAQFMSCKIRTSAWWLPRASILSTEISRALPRYTAECIGCHRGAAGLVKGHKHLRQLLCK